MRSKSRRFSFGRGVAALGLGALALLWARGALAVGLEVLPEGGARSVSRGGAVAAKPEDPMAISANPAGLAFLEGHQVVMGADLAVNNLCVKPYGYYGWGVYSPGTTEFGNQLALNNPTNPTIGATYATTPLPGVCNSAPSVPVPQLAWAGKVTDRLALGFGFIAPIVVTGLQFGGADGTVQTQYGPRPTPTRYSMVKQTATDALAPAASIAYQILPNLAAGLTAQIIMVRAQATLVQNEFGGTQPSTDWLATITTQDFFIPTLTASVHAKPLSFLDLMGAFHWSDDVHGSGDVVYETNTYYRGAKSGPVPYKNPPISLSDVTLKQPWLLTGGVRVHGDLSDAGKVGDPMDSELWDFEVDASYSFYKRSGGTTVSVGQDVSVTTRDANDGAGVTTAKKADLSALNLDRHLQDVYTVRAGASYSLLPRKLMINAGGFYESRGVDPAYADIDTFAFRRIGTGVGAVLRLGKFDVALGYGHVFSETLKVVPPPQQNVEDATPGNPTSGFDQRVGGSFDTGARTGGVVLPDPNATKAGAGDATAAKAQQAAASTKGQPNRVVNAGEYTASFNLVSVSVVYHF
jgi:hypothetical protein